MRNTQKKLEEYMYLSLIGKFVDIQVINQKTYACFSTKNKKDSKVAPIYLTSTEDVSENTLLKRVSSFEKKVFEDEDYIKNLKTFETSEDKLCFVKRMKAFVDNFENTKEKNIVLKNYKTNTTKLYNAGLIQDEELRIVDEFVEKQMGKDKKVVPTLATFE